MNYFEKLELFKKNLLFLREVRRYKFTFLMLAVIIVFCGLF